jgi:hypothetical protein
LSPIFIILLYLHILNYLLIFSFYWKHWDIFYDIRVIHVCCLIQSICFTLDFYIYVHGFLEDTLNYNYNTNVIMKQILSLDTFTGIYLCIFCFKNIIIRSLPAMCNAAHCLSLKIFYVINGMSFSSLIMIYYSLFHSVLAYGILFWGKSSSSDNLFKLQKRVVCMEIGLHVRFF